MSVSGTRNFSLVRDDIILMALRKVKAIAPGKVPSSEMLSDASNNLDVMVQEWQNDGILLWTLDFDLQVVSEDVSSYNLDADVLDVRDAFWRSGDSDVSLTRITRSEWNEIRNKKTGGSPTSYYIDTQLAQPVMYLWPRPEITTGVVTGTDSNTYICIKDHTATSSDRPIDGSDYATYWEQVVGESGSSWVSGTEYKSGVVRYTKILRLQDFGGRENNPDFPTRWYGALVYGLAFSLSFNYGMEPEDRTQLGIIASAKKKAAMGGEGESVHVQFSPYRM